MKKQALLFLFGILVTSGSALFFSRQYDPASGNFLLEGKANGRSLEDKKRNALDALQWRFNRLKDENGNVNPAYFQNAVSQADMMTQYGSRSALGLQWQELGPDNVGGRTRAILIDKRDPTRSTIYAGGVSGGMWKSLDGGSTWNRLTNWNQWMAVSCIIQGPAPSYTIYIGTGEGFGTCLGDPCGSKFLSGAVGNGIFTLDANDNPVEFAFNNSMIGNTLSNTQTGDVITRIAVDPQNGQQFAVATGHGLFLSGDSGVTWTQPAINSIPNGQFVDDVVWASDGGNMYAAIGSPLGTAVKLVMSPDGGQTWYQFTTQKNAGFPSTQGRLEIAVAPSDPNYVYILVATASGATYGLYRTDNANDNGTACTWTTLATAGPLFDPFNVGENQGWYDNIIAVNPFNPNKVCMGGVNFYTWGNLSGAQLADAGLGGGAVNPYYTHPDKHAIVFSDVDSNIMFVGCDGGIYKSVDAAVDFPYPTFTASNQSYNVTQNYSIAAAITGEVIGGAQDNGTNYIDYKGNTNMAAQEVLGGDGAYVEISHLDPKVFFGGVYYGNYDRSGNYSSSFEPFYDLKLDPQGWNEPSRCGGEKNTNAPFIDAMYLSETANAANGLRKVRFIANQSYAAGNVISLLSNTDNLPFQFTLDSAVVQGDTIYVNDPIRSRLFLSSYCGTWVTSDALELGNIPHWYKLMNNMTGTPVSYAATASGDTLYVGTDAGIVYQFNHMNARCDTTSYPSGSVNVGVIYPTGNQMNSSLAASGREIGGISVDPTNSNHVAIAIDGFSATNQPHVYESQDGGRTWSPDTSGLPNMPVYDIVIHDPNTIIVSTEFGIWSWDGSSWHEENNGIPRVPSYRLIEKELYTGGCNVLYLGTHGRGMWRSTTLTNSNCQLTPGITPTGVTNVPPANISGINIFPNPVNTVSKISLSVDKDAAVMFRVFDMTGKLCKEIPQQNAIAGENLYQLDASGLPSGTYLLSATVNNARTQSKLFTVVK